jgi:hypothetical protein
MKGLVISVLLAIGGCTLNDRLVETVQDPVCGKRVDKEDGRCRTRAASKDLLLRLGRLRAQVRRPPGALLRRGLGHVPRVRLLTLP